MKVSIWDLDYYYAECRTNMKNPDVMKISSYHKQMGDKINFVTKKDDIYRPFDLYYIIKEKSTTPQPPIDFFTFRNIRWWGKCYQARIKWHMPDQMLIARPDYLLYPELETKEERSEYIQLFNHENELLPAVQDWSNTFKNKFVYVADKNMWDAKNEDIVVALQRLHDCKNVSFLHQINIQKILSDEKIRDEFLKIHFTRGSKFSWMTIGCSLVDEAWDFVAEIKKRNSGVALSSVCVDYAVSGIDHWESRDAAQQDFEALKRLIVRAKNEGCKVTIKMPATRLETPYFFVFEELATWTKRYFTLSWLEYITNRFGNKRNEIQFWNNPSAWGEIFRDLLRQTWMDREFLLTRWQGTSINESRIAWKVLEKEFSYGI